jgi:hypothetical protein
MSCLCRHRGKAELQLDPICNLGARRVWLVSTTPWPLYPPGKTGYPLQETGWASGPVWAGTENPSSQRDSIPAPPNQYRVATATTLPRSPSVKSFRTYSPVRTFVRRNCRSRRMWHRAGSVSSWHVSAFESWGWHAYYTQCVSATELTHFLL